MQHRYEDMSPTGGLAIDILEDGFYLELTEDVYSGWSSVEFTTPFIGGGQSRKTWECILEFHRSEGYRELELPDHGFVKVLEDQDADAYFSVFVPKLGPTLKTSIHLKDVPLNWEVFLFSLYNAMAADNKERKQYREP
jgi:hypothetical protein